MNTGYLGDTTPKLGFGLMRLPMIGDEIDMEQTKAMVDTFMAKGFTYFDTAYVYINGKSEVAAREAIVKRYPRDSFTLATKLPLWDNIETEADMQRIFDESMERAGVEYFDYYLLHAMDKAKFEKADRTFAITISSQLSGSMNSALTARDLALEADPDKKIAVLDSRSTGPELVLCVRYF